MGEVEMGREIKFRWWNSYDCKMVYFNFDDIYGGKIEFGALNFNLQPSFVMQLTGLQDSNGVDIYEGDLVVVSGTGLCRVEIQPYCGVVFIGVTDDTHDTTAHDAQMENEDIYITGNIHENPELLK